MSFVSNAANLAIQKRARHFFREKLANYDRKICKSSTKFSGYDHCSGKLMSVLD